MGLSSSLLVQSSVQDKLVDFFNLDSNMIEFDNHPLLSVITMKEIMNLIQDNNSPEGNECRMLLKVVCESLKSVTITKEEITIINNDDKKQEILVSLRDALKKKFS